ncbi:polypeptide N-acetylgalactosaminyltransferase 13 isoform X2 [Agrilus planipennis]|uniref:Polypeptide N-acetylgalactosaminyltransferase n=1 Tax=Agrilus planipennis TaxID=224129 RepID=A0A1W4XAW7_AGRPL|nr:polypeptide N-acetylgalactosaminyltransferase 13 isoform X2 [Agrilus planipennis]
MLTPGPYRRCRRLWQAILFLFICALIIVWKRSNRLEEKSTPSNKHVFRHNQEEYVDHRGVKVIVGHYIGNAVENIPNADKNVINRNNYSPMPDAGKNGFPVIIEPKDLLVSQQIFQINRFNLLASDRIPLNRTLPDVRRKKCKFLYKDYNSYPKASIIIVFHNEAWSTLFRTVWSVINRSPEELLEEIILVDDASERDFLRDPLDEYIKKLPVPTKILRSKTRIGLVHARMMGSREAKGASLVFLDAHCECTIGWLESLLAPIAEDRTTVVCPVIDIINDNTFAYIKSFELHWGAFNWNLQFRWYTLGNRELQKRKQNITRPFHTPAMAGGLFAISKEYFFEIGGYDEGMKIWGGENLEISFRVWQCGGKVVIAPCSHVGHLFRKSSPYTFPGGIGETLYSNLARVAMVWMDEWGDFYFKFNNEARKAKELQDVQQRIKLRDKLKCQSFRWYLENIWPQHFFPTESRFFGRIRNLEKDQCLIKPIGKESSNQPMGLANINICVNKSLTVEMFVMTEDGIIMTDDSVCLDAPETTVNSLHKVRIMACSGTRRQRWKYNKKTQELVHATNGFCLDVSSSKTFEDGLIISNCTGVRTQKWILEPHPWK